MASKGKSKSGVVVASDPNTLTIKDVEGKSRERLLTEVAFSPFSTNADTARKFAKAAMGDLHLGESVAVLREKAELVQRGDLSEVEATLSAQAVALDTIFNSLATRAALNAGQYIGACETYLRLALKAQAQCRATLETLAEIKYPKAPTFVRQQNVAYQQQVNNGDGASGTEAPQMRKPAHGKNQNQSNELLEAQHGERLDSRATGAAGNDDSDMEALAAIDGSANARREVHGFAERP